jgi:hypothetical protein
MQQMLLTKQQIENSLPNAAHPDKAGMETEKDHSLQFTVP